MRKLLLTAPIALCIGLAACGQKAATNTTSSATTTETTAAAAPAAPAAEPATAPDANATADAGGGDRPRRGAQAQTLDQMLDRSMNRFAKLDLNGDGKLTKDELDKAPAPKGGDDSGEGRQRVGVAEATMRADANHDGVVTKDEFAAQTRERFKRLDANGDGTVTPDEMQAQREKAEARRAARAAKAGAAAQ